MMEAARLLESSLATVVEGLQERGFSEDDQRKFLDGNFRRVFERVWRAWRNDA